MTDPQLAIRVSDLPPGAQKTLCLAGHPILLVNDGGTILAIANECSHAFMALEGGRVMNGWIACPAHGARFDLATGEALGTPATAPVQTYRVRVEGGLVFVEL